MSETTLASRQGDALFNLKLLPGMTDTLAQGIYQSGYASFQLLTQAVVTDVQGVPGYEEVEKAEKLIADAKALVAKYKAEGTPIPTRASVVTVAVGTDAKSLADQRLKEELAQLNSQENPVSTESAATPEENS